MYRRTNPKQRLFYFSSFWPSTGGAVFSTAEAGDWKNAVSWYKSLMSIDELEQTVATLPPERLAKFSAWFEEFMAARFDAKIESDIKAGKLDALADEALADGSKSVARSHE